MDNILASKALASKQFDLGRNLYKYSVERVIRAE
jgi:hypothetical protein